MKQIKLLTLEINNFMGIRHYLLDTENGKNVSIKGMNASGKSTIFNSAIWLLFGKNKDILNENDGMPIPDRSDDPKQFFVLVC